MLRTTKVLLILMVALWGLIGASHNIADWPGTMGSVGAAASMVTFDGGTESWKATSNPLVIWIGALMIVLGKLAAGLLCGKGAMTMWGARNSDAEVFQAAKHAALAGCGIALLMLFGAFIVIGETWFEMWRSDVMRDLSLQSAFRYAGMITLIALFVGARDD